MCLSARSRRTRPLILRAGLFKKRQSLLTPIQDEIYTAVKALSEEKGYTLILDRATGDNIIFASPKMDISEEVLQKLGD